MSPFEIIIVGGDQNSLTAAAYLAAAGLKVLVLDQE
ncbi:MAG: NAD(P)-binding protein [Steroidobacteraceae bacterium]